MKIARTIAECRRALAALPRPLGLVPTMGALHDGHLALVHSARERCASVVASLFVNPTQFGRGEDFEKYPRDEARDFALFEQAGVDVLFAPAAAEMYPPGAATTVHISGPLGENPLGEAFEGAQRPGHFDGVATVVSALFAIVAPDVACFGQKDAQQLAVIRRLTADLHLPVEIVAVETVREPDGLARSSRNVYLTPEQRATAPALYRALLAGRAAAGEPADDATPAAAATPADVIAATTATLAATSFAVDYVAVVDGDSFVSESSIGPRSLLIAAARLGATRLLDNIFLATSATQPISAYPAGDATN